MDHSETHLWYSLVSWGYARHFRFSNLSKMAARRPFSEIQKMLNNSLNMIEVWIVMTSNRKSWSKNLMVMLDLTYDLSFKVICNFNDQTYANHALSPLLWHIEIQYVLPSYRKSLSRNPLVMLDLTYDILFNVICDFPGQTYENHALSPLSWPVEIQYV